MYNFINYAHRGASAYAPENTMSSFKKAIQLGANGIELDLQQTKDRKVVIFHDKVIDKKSNGKGKIRDYTYQELYKLDFGSWFNEDFKGEHIVLFENFAKEFLDLDLTFAIEIKTAGIEKEVLNIINKYKTHDNIYITSFKYKILENVRNLDKNIKISYLIEKIDQDSINKILRIYGNQICPQASFVTTKDITLAKSNNLGVRLWGISDENIMKRVSNYDIEGMTVNFPDKLLEFINDINCSSC